MHEWSPANPPRTETLGAVTASSIGTTVTASASANTKGSYASIGTAGFTYEYLIITLAAALTSDYTLDLQVYDGANGWIVAEDLRLCCLRADYEMSATYALPLHIPSGAQLRARVQASTGSTTVRVNIIGFSTSLTGMPGYSKCFALYAPATSRGVAVDPGAVANTKTRVQIVASSASLAKGVFGYVGLNGDIGRGGTISTVFDLEFGAASSESVLGTFQITADTASDAYGHGVIPVIPCHIVTASRFSVNAQSASTVGGDRTFDFALWGLV